ncbi:MAG TPA: DUF5317 domain-containing protein [Egibacteraceae bacterium]|nr:DUF5317 domain-containing protein [Egibacteraceae bacterium]
MVLVLVTVLGAILAGYARGGRLANLGHVALRHGWLVLVSVLPQAVLAAVSATGGPAHALSAPLLLASHAALLAFVVVNRMLPGMLLVFAGFAMNAAVITVNGAMPVSRHALLAVSAGEATSISPGKHRLLAEGDLLTPLADIFAVPMLRTVVSAGDVVLAAGVGILVVNLMLRQAAPSRRRRQPRGGAGQVTARAGDASAAEPVERGDEPLA